MSSSMEWYKFANEVIGMNTFGGSAPANDLFDKFGFTQEKLKTKIASIVNANK